MSYFAFKRQDYNSKMHTLKKEYLKELEKKNKVDQSQQNERINITVEINKMENRKQTEKQNKSKS